MLDQRSDNFSSSGVRRRPTGGQHRVWRVCGTHAMIDEPESEGPPGHRGGGRSPTFCIRISKPKTIKKTTDKT